MKNSNHITVCSLRHIENGVMFFELGQPLTGPNGEEIHQVAVSFGRFMNEDETAVVPILPNGEKLWRESTILSREHNRAKALELAELKEVMANGHFCNCRPEVNDWIYVEQGVHPRIKKHHWKCKKCAGIIQVG